MDRRKFIQQATISTTALTFGGGLFNQLHAATSNTNLVILHTNDVHSRLEPFPMDGGRNQGLGGVAARAELIGKIRSENEHVLLLDSGDIFQGTPFFNIYKGEPEIKAMSMMGYDASIMGNHDFDAGIENFALQLQHANFPIIMCNYNFNGTPMETKHLPYKIIKKGKLKIGITGVGIELQSLVPDNLTGGTKYLSPIEEANKTADILKNKKHCDMVICLSHLGYKYNDNKVSDITLAKESENIDLILGGHTHTFLDKPEVIKNKKGNDVIINQVGFAGIILGRLDFTFNGVRKRELKNALSVTIGKKSYN